MTADGYIEDTTLCIKAMMGRVPCGGHTEKKPEAVRFLGALLAESPPGAEGLNFLVSLSGLSRYDN